MVSLKSNDWKTSISNYSVRYSESHLTKGTSFNQVYFAAVIYECKVVWHWLVSNSFQCSFISITKFSLLGDNIIDIMTVKKDSVMKEIIGLDEIPSEWRINNYTLLLEEGWRVVFESSYLVIKGVKVFDVGSNFRNCIFYLQWFLLSIAWMCLRGVVACWFSQTANICSNGTFLISYSLS